MSREKIKLPNYHVPMVDHTIRVLEAFPNGDIELSLKETSSRAGVGRTSTLRILFTLARFGYIHRNSATGRYRLGSKVIEMGRKSLPGRKIVHAARPYLQQLFKEFNETVNLAVLQDGDLVYVECLESSHAFRMAANVGSRVPLHSTALGKSIGAFLSGVSLQGLLERCEWTRFTPQTIISRKQFLEILNQVRKQGYSVDNEETELGGCCVAVPILDQNLQSLAALSIAGPAHRIRAKQKLLIRKIKAASAAISKEFKGS
jgi:IclR family transcriptional regulator, KDG regulon repressor